MQRNPTPKARKIQIEKTVPHKLGLNKKCTAFYKSANNNNHELEEN